jgi:hypothetical protein
VAPAQQPVALLYGRGLVVVHGNEAFVREFGSSAVGLPAVEGLLPLPSRVLEVARRVMAQRRPLACWIEVGSRTRRLTVAPRLDIETGEAYGVAIRLACVGTPGTSPPDQS